MSDEESQTKPLDIGTLASREEADFQPQKMTRHTYAYNLGSLRCRSLREEFAWTSASLSRSLKRQDIEK